MNYHSKRVNIWPSLTSQGNGGRQELKMVEKAVRIHFLFYVSFLMKKTTFFSVNIQSHLQTIYDYSSDDGFLLGLDGWDYFRFFFSLTYACFFKCILHFIFFLIVYYVGGDSFFRKPPIHLTCFFFVYDMNMT